jgi:hypothetical protein
MPKLADGGAASWEKKLFKLAARPGRARLNGPKLLTAKATPEEMLRQFGPDATPVDEFVANKKRAGAAAAPPAADAGLWDA